VKKSFVSVHDLNRAEKTPLMSNRTSPVGTEKSRARHVSAG
jgi:hypothetical protein